MKAGLLPLCILYCFGLINLVYFICSEVLNMSQSLCSDCCVIELFYVAKLMSKFGQLFFCMRILHSNTTSENMEVLRVPVRVCKSDYLFTFYCAQKKDIVHTFLKPKTELLLYVIYSKLTSQKEHPQSFKYILLRLFNVTLFIFFIQYACTSRSLSVCLNDVAGAVLLGSFQFSTISHTSVAQKYQNILVS